MNILSILLSRKIHPIDGGMIAAMRSKDPELYAVVGPMTVSQAWRVWKEKYPEDFPDGGMGTIGSHNIMPKAP